MSDLSDKVLGQEYANLSKEEKSVQVVKIVVEALGTDHCTEEQFFQKLLQIGALTNDRKGRKAFKKLFEDGIPDGYDAPQNLYVFVPDEGGHTYKVVNKWFDEY